VASLFVTLMAKSIDRMEIYYCSGWFFARKRATEIWDEATARAAHEARTPYAAVLGSVASPHAVVTVMGDCVAVSFLDDRLREHVDYEFYEKLPGRLFMSRAVFRKYVGDSDRLREAEVYTIRDDGRVTVGREDILRRAAESMDTQTDVSIFWEPYPSFGDYASIARLERQA
jgi:hypothetical protein